MQTGSMARRIQVSYGEPTGVLDGLVKFGEVSLEAHTIDVPTFNRIVKIQSGIVQMPEVQLSYETKDDKKTRKFLRDWWKNKDQKDMTIFMVDATGTVREEVLWSSVEIKRFSEPEADLANPTYARIDITLLPNDIVPVADVEPAPAPWSGAETTPSN